MIFSKLHRTIASIRTSSSFCYRGYRQEEQENRLCQVQSSLLSLLLRSTSPHHYPLLSPCSFTLTFRYTLVVDDKEKAAKFERDLPKALPPSERLATCCICHPFRAMSSTCTAKGSGPFLPTSRPLQRSPSPKSKHSWYDCRLFVGSSYGTWRRRRALQMPTVLQSHPSSAL